MMMIQDYIGEDNRKIIDFALSLLETLQVKLNRREFFYYNQVTNYVKKRIDLYLAQTDNNDALNTIYKRDIYAIVEPKVKQWKTTYRLFESV